MHASPLKIIVVMGRSLSLLLIGASFLVAHAQQLPLKTYTTADGLAQNVVNKIVRDSRGFLWFCTADGLSRFDGYAFTNYRMAQGLPHRWIGDLLETREGEFWIGTGSGIVLFNPAGELMDKPVIAHDGALPSSTPMFTTFYPSEQYKEQTGNVLLQDRAGVIWVGTDHGLFRMMRDGKRIAFEPVDIGMNAELPDASSVAALCEDRHGTLWIVGGSNLYRRWPDGRTKRYDTGVELTRNYSSLGQDRAGYLWTAGDELLQLKIEAGYDAPVTVHRRFGRREEFTGKLAGGIFESADNSLWFASDQGLYHLLPTVDGRSSLLLLYKKRNGLNDNAITALNEDRDDNLWIGAIGALKLSRSGFVSYDEADGIIYVNWVFGDASGEPHFFGMLSNEQPRNVAEVATLYEKDPQQLRKWGQLGRFDGNKFAWLKPGLPKEVTTYGFSQGPGVGQVSFQDHTGEWWLTSTSGLLRYSKVNRFEDLAGARPKAVYTTKDGLASNVIHHLFEDSHGDIWIVTFFSDSQGGLSLWERRTGTFRDMTKIVGYPSRDENQIETLAEDHVGNIWFGLRPGGLLRYHDNRFTFFSVGEGGVPRGWVNELLVDRKGRLWLASARNGLVRVEDPSAERPVFDTFTTSGGLASDYTSCLAEDKFGRIYVGTRRGLDRLDPETNRIKHFTSADGLPEGDLYSLYGDRNGDIWIGNQAGLARYTPRPEVPAVPPEMLISGLRLMGEKQVVSALGETKIALRELSHSENQLQIDFVGLSFAPGETLRYQYLLEGADANWSAPTEQRTVNYGNLAPGKYKFAVRAINSEGAMSPTPAFVTFTILYPLWRRGWFLSLTVVLMGLVIYFVYRYRLGRLLELERIRTRIATDLHDDVGSGLSQVSILSEVISRRVGPEKGVAEQLSIMGSLSRELVDSMSDIVWAINPGRDRLSDLSQRMRRFASDVFTAQAVEFTFDVPNPGRDVRLGPEIRRELYLIFKEAVNNVVRHSGCTAVKITFLISDGALELSVHDNGEGFDPECYSEGNGLANMRLRAKKLGGELRIGSNNGDGTAVHLIAPLDRRRWFGLGLKRNRT